MPGWILRTDQQPRRGPWTREELAAIEAYIAERGVTRIENGFWPYHSTNWHQAIALFLSGRRDPWQRRF